MKVSRYQPVIVEPPAPRRCHFKETVRIRLYDPSAPIQENIDAARLRASLKRPDKPCIKPKPKPKPKKVTVPPQPAFKPLAGVMTIIGIGLVAGLIASNPIGAAIGIALIMGALIYNASPVSQPKAKAKRTHINQFDVLVNRNYQTKSQVLDLRYVVITSLPDYLHEFDHLNYILINQETAQYLKRKHGRIKIIVSAER